MSSWLSSLGMKKLPSTEMESPIAPDDPNHESPIWQPRELVSGSSEETEEADEKEESGAVVELLTPWQEDGVGGDTWQLPNFWLNLEPGRSYQDTLDLQVCRLCSIGRLLGVDPRRRRKKPMRKKRAGAVVELLTPWQEDGVGGDTWQLPNFWLNLEPGRSYQDTLDLQVCRLCSIGRLLGVDPRRRRKKPMRKKRAGAVVELLTPWQEDGVGGDTWQLPNFWLNLEPGRSYQDTLDLQVCRLCSIGRLLGVDPRRRRKKPMRKKRAGAVVELLTPWQEDGVGGDTWQLPNFWLNLEPGRSYQDTLDLQVCRLCSIGRLLGVDPRRRRKKPMRKKRAGAVVELLTPWQEDGVGGYTWQLPNFWLNLEPGRSYQDTLDLQVCRLCSIGRLLGVDPRRRRKKPMRKKRAGAVVELLTPWQEDGVGGYTWQLPNFWLNLEPGRSYQDTLDLQVCRLCSIGRLLGVDPRRRRKKPMRKKRAGAVVELLTPWQEDGVGGDTWQLPNFWLNLEPGRSYQDTLDLQVCRLCSIRRLLGVDPRRRRKKPMRKKRAGAVVELLTPWQEDGVGGDTWQLPNFWLNLEPGRNYQDTLDLQHFGPLEGLIPSSSNARLGQGHDFQLMQLSTPTWCDKCGDFIWGFYKQAVTCSQCNFTCHYKCRLLVTLDCRSLSDSEKSRGCSDHGIQSRIAECNFTCHYKCRLLVTLDCRSLSDSEKSRGCSDHGIQSRIAECNFTCHYKCRLLVTLDCRSLSDSEKSRGCSDHGIQSRIAECNFTCHYKCRLLVTLDCRSLSDSEKSRGCSDHGTFFSARSARTAAISSPTDDGIDDAATEVTELESEIGRLGLEGEALDATRLPTGPELVAAVSSYNDASNGLHMTVSEDGHSFTGYLQIHMNFTRPINIVSGREPPSIYDVLKEDTLVPPGAKARTITSFFLPRNTMKTVHLTSDTTTMELIVLLLRKFRVADCPRKFALYTRPVSTPGSTLKTKLERVGEDVCPLRLALAWGPAAQHRFVLQENDTGDIMWDAFEVPELTNFLKILDNEEAHYIYQLKQRFAQYKHYLMLEIKHKGGTVPQASPNNLQAPPPPPLSSDYAEFPTLRSDDLNGPPPGSISSLQSQDWQYGTGTL